MVRNKTAEKRHRQSLKRRDRNRHFTSMMRNAVKKARAAVEDNAEGAASAVREACSVIARVAQKGVIPKTTAARKISRLATALSKASK